LEALEREDAQAPGGHPGEEPQIRLRRGRQLGLGRRRPREGGRAADGHVAVAADAGGVLPPPAAVLPRHGREAAGGELTTAQPAAPHKPEAQAKDLSCPSLALQACNVGRSCESSQGETRTREPFLKWPRRDSNPHALAGTRS